MSDTSAEIDISKKTLDNIRNGVLAAEEEQLSYQKPHDIIPEIEEIIEQEIQPEDVPEDSEP